MELVAILATFILMATVLTLVFAFASYFVSRRKRRMKKEKEPDSGSPPESSMRAYFERYYPEGGAEQEAPDSSEKSGQDNQWI